MPRDHVRRPARLLVLLLVGLLGLAGPVAQASPAPRPATAPARLATQLQDTAGVLDDGARSTVQQALDQLYASDRLRLWVVYVDSFDGLDRTTWAARTRQLSDLGATDVVLGVAVTDRSYYLDTTGVSAVSASEQQALQTDEVEPALRSQDWAGAARATATGLAAAVGSSGSGGSLLGPVLVGLVLLLGLGGALLWARRRRRTREQAQADAAQRVDGTDRDALGRLPVPALRARAERAVTETDDAVRASREELALATGELGETATSGFARALADAERALARAMATRQVLDDDVPETDEAARTMLVELVVAATTADRALDEQVEQFRGARDLLVGGPERVEALVQALVSARVRLDGSTATLARLRQDFPASALAPVDGNVDLAAEHLTLVEDRIEAARAALARPVGEQGALVDAVRTAETALDRTTALLDGVDHAATDIPHARATLPAAVDDAEQGVRRARELAAAAPASARPGPELEQALRAVEAALRTARERGDADPLGSLG
ncbi:TPM domain-containing protein, partial [Rhodococcus aerolatus]